jgi:hypothetical protein
MTLIAFWVYTIIAGTIFVYAILWIISQWLKADEEVEQIEKEIGLQKESLESTQSARL